MGARARFQQGQAIILLHQVVQFAAHVLIEPLEQENVQLVVEEGKSHGRVTGVNRQEVRLDLEAIVSKTVAWNRASHAFAAQLSARKLKDT